MYVYNDEMLSMPQQVAKNKEDIKTLQNTIPYPINWRGLWNQDNTYNKYDGVNFQGSSYVCISDVAIQSTTPPPQAPFVWQVFAQQGEQGAKGETGATGPQGPIGLSNLWVTSVVATTGIPNKTTIYEINKNLFSRTPIIGEDCIIYFSDTNTNKIYLTIGMILEELTHSWKYTAISIEDITGTGFNYMGEWVSGSEHYINDIVTYGGNAYICIQNITNSVLNPEEDTLHWNIFVTSGLNYFHKISFMFQIPNWGNSEEAKKAIYRGVMYAINKNSQKYNSLQDFFNDNKNTQPFGFFINTIPQEDGSWKLYRFGYAFRITDTKFKFQFSDFDTAYIYDFGIPDSYCAFENIVETTFYDYVSITN